MDTSNKFVVKLGHQDLFSFGNFVKETKTQYIVNVQGKDIRFSKKNNKEINPYKDQWDKYSLCLQTIENYLKVEKYELKNKIQKESRDLSEYCRCRHKNLSLDDLKEIDENLTNALNIFKDLSD